MVVTSRPFLFEYLGGSPQTISSLPNYLNIESMFTFDGLSPLSWTANTPDFLQNFTDLTNETGYIIFSSSIPYELYSATQTPVASKMITNKYQIAEYNGATPLTISTSLFVNEIESIFAYDSNGGLLAWTANTPDFLQNFITLDPGFTYFFINKDGFTPYELYVSMPFPPIPDMQLWLDASDLSTTFDATVGGNLVTTNGSAVARWEDKSGNDNHFTQATAGSRPVLNLANQNNKSVIYFDGNNDLISGTVTGFNSFNAVTVIMVTKPTIAAGPDVNSLYGWQWGSATTITNRMSFGYVYNSPINQETFGMMINNNRGILASTTYSRAANTAQILTVTLSPTGTKLYANSSEVTLNLASAATTTSNSSPSNYGWTADSIIRLNGTGNNGPSNRLCEFLVFNRVLNSTETTDVWNYLTTKWNIV